MKFGQILVCCMTNICNMFLIHCWKRETSYRPFYDFIKMTIWQDLAIFNSWHLTFWNVPYKPFEKNEFQKNMVQKIHSKLHPVSYTNTHHDIKDLLNHGMVENTKTWLSWEQSITFLWNKKILNLCLRWHIMRSCHFAVEVTFNFLSCRYLGATSWFGISIWVVS